MYMDAWNIWKNKCNKSVYVIAWWVWQKKNNDARASKKATNEAQIKLTRNARISMQRDFTLVEHIVERRPAAARIEFGLGAEQLLVTHDALVQTFFVKLVVFAFNL